MTLTRIYKEFFKSEKTAGLILIALTIISLILANSSWRDSYLSLWNLKLGGHGLTHWINDGLMTIFFLLIGLELEREFYKGELNNLKSAYLPIFAAFGGMLFPAGIYVLFNFGTESISGAGIPMATDIAFALGFLSILGNKVPASLKIFLTSFAVIDDLGAIIIIGIFYSKAISFTYLAYALGIFCFLILLNKIHVKNIILYLIGGIVMWYFMSSSGIHPTITGVLLAFAIPFTNGSEKSPSYRLQHFLHKPVAFIILPIFVLANTGIAFESEQIRSLAQPHNYGIIAGLIIGKPLGILLLSIVCIKSGLGVLPSELKWENIAGVGFLGGIGFTMSIFITLLAFNRPEMVNSAKIAVFIGSFIAGLIGLLWLKLTLKNIFLED